MKAFLCLAAFLTVSNAQFLYPFYGRYFATAPAVVAAPPPPVFAAAAPPVFASPPVLAAPPPPVFAAPPPPVFAASPAVFAAPRPVFAAAAPLPAPVVPAFAPFASAAYVFGSNKNKAKSAPSTTTVAPDQSE